MKRFTTVISSFTQTNSIFLIPVSVHKKVSEVLFIGVCAARYIFRKELFVQIKITTFFLKFIGLSLHAIVGCHVVLKRVVIKIKAIGVHESSWSLRCTHQTIKQTNQLRVDLNY